MTSWVSTVVCPDCGHQNGDREPFQPERWFAKKLGIKLKPKLMECRLSQSYEDDELFTCTCNNPVHSN